MEGFLRLGLLLIAACIIFLILFEAWYRRRQMDVRNDERPGQRILDPDEILGLQPVETVFTPDSSEAQNYVPRLQKDEDRSTAFLMGASKSATKVLSPALYTQEMVEEPEPSVELAAEEVAPVVQPEKPRQEPQMEMHIDQPRKETVKTASSPSDFVMLSVVAKPHVLFASYELLQAISATGMTFGDMNIFHYQRKEGENMTTLFSLASATEPGEFNLDNIGHFSCGGLILFMNLRKVRNPKEAYELMLKTAEQLAEDLDGELKANPRDPWTPQIKERYLQRVLEFQYMKQ
jgi:cell division protein ZipA